MSKTAVVIGVGPIEGLGGYLCTQAANEGLHVVIAGRTLQSIESVADAIRSNGVRRLPWWPMPPMSHRLSS